MPVSRNHVLGHDAPERMLQHAMLCQTMSVVLITHAIRLLGEGPGRAGSAPADQPPPVSDARTSAPYPDDRLNVLTERQAQVLRLLAQEGLSNRKIGRKLGISESTVKAHMHAIFGKLGASDRTDAVIKAFGNDATRLHVIRRNPVKRPDNAAAG